MELAQAQKIAAEVVKRLSAYCKRIEVAGSIRRKKPFCNDIDLVLVPSDAWNLSGEISGLGPTKLRGERLKRVSYNGVQVDIYYATADTWATLLLIRTGSTESNIHLASLAKKRGWHLAANGDGLFNEKGQRVAGDTEHSIFEALGLQYVPPEKR